MSNATLSERLAHLRGLIAEGGDTNSLLFETDKLISLEKHLQLRRKEAGVDALQQEVRALARKLKEAAKHKKAQEELVNNLTKDLEITAVKCRNLEDKLKLHNQTVAREKRTEVKREHRNTVDCEVQADILSFTLVEELMRNYRSEMKENDRLRQELGDLREVIQNPEVDMSVASTNACDDES
jgi:hypothetical protein